MKRHTGNGINWSEIFLFVDSVVAFECDSNVVADRSNDFANVTFFQKDKCFAKKR